MRRPNRLPMYDIGTTGVPDEAHYEDSEKFYFGSSDDFNIYYDGTNNKLILNDGTTDVLQLTKSATPVVWVRNQLYVYEDTEPLIDLRDDDGKRLQITKHTDGHATIKNDEGEIRFLASADTDDYLTLNTTSHVPTLGTTGSCNLKITSSGGTIDFSDDNTTTTGSATAATMATGQLSSSTGAADLVTFAGIPTDTSIFAATGVTATSPTDPVNIATWINVTINAAAAWIPIYT